MASAQAACGPGDTTTGSQTAATITLTGTGPAHLVRLCVTDDVIWFGLYGTANGANPGYNARSVNFLPMAGQSSFSSLNYTTSKATYTLTPLDESLTKIPEYTITLNSVTGTGTDTITLWYADGCSYSGGCIPNPALTNTSFTITVNLPVPPSVTSISPTAGPTGGGNSVIITGTDLSGATGAGAVKFGTIDATAYTVNSNTQISATAPAGTGMVDVRVTTPGGTSAIVPEDKYTYVPAPTITSVSPALGPASGGTEVTITGTNFSGTAAVSFGATPGINMVFVSPTSITVKSPAGTGTVDVRVTTAGGMSAIVGSGQFTYIPAPTVTSLTPTAGPTSGGTSVTITGTNFTGATAVTFGATAAAFTFNSSTSITATAPAGSGAVDIRVITPGGTSAISAAGQFNYVAAPAITAISPTSGPTGGLTTVIITGTNLSGATGPGGVRFGGNNAAYTVNSNTQITATSPAGSAGAVDVTVTTPGGTSVTSSADQFTYVAAPTVTSISPHRGQPAAARSSPSPAPISALPQP